MTKEEALAWVKGERSYTNMIPHDPHETWMVRIAQADAAETQRAYWVLRAHKEGLVEEANDDD